MPSRWTSVLLGVCVLAVVLSEIDAAQQCFTWTLYSEDFEDGFQTKEAWKVLEYEDNRRHGGASSQKSGSVLEEKDRRHSGGAFVFPQHDCNDAGVVDTYPDCDNRSEDDYGEGWSVNEVDVGDDLKCYGNSLEKPYKKIYGECMFGQFDDDTKPQLRLSNLPMHSSITIALNVITEEDWAGRDKVDISQNGKFLFEFSRKTWNEDYGKELFALERGFFNFADGNGDEYSGDRIRLMKNAVDDSSNDDVDRIYRVSTTFMHTGSTSTTLFDFSTGNGLGNGNGDNFMIDGIWVGMTHCIEEPTVCDLERACRDDTTDYFNATCDARQSTFMKLDDPPVDFLLDDDKSTCMKTATANSDPNPQWVSVDLGEDRLVGTVRFVSTGEASDFSVEIAQADAGSGMAVDGKTPAANPTFGGVLPDGTVKEACPVTKVSDGVFEALCPPAIKGQYLFVRRTAPHQELEVCDLEVFAFECVAVAEGEDVSCGLGHEPTKCKDCHGCTPCQPGFYSDKVGPYECSPCPGNPMPYSPAGSTSMFQCEGDAFIEGTSSIDVTTATFNQTIDAWEIDVIYSVAPRTELNGIAALYLPRGGDGVSETDKGDSTIWDPRNFPCRADTTMEEGADRSASLTETVCCLQDMRQDYVMTKIFRDFTDGLDLVAANDVCDSDTGSDELVNADLEVVGEGTTFLDENGQPFAEPIHVEPVEEEDAIDRLIKTYTIFEGCYNYLDSAGGSRRQGGRTSTSREMRELIEQMCGIYYGETGAARRRAAKNAAATHPEPISGLRGGSLHGEYDSHTDSWQVVASYGFRGFGFPKYLLQPLPETRTARITLPDAELFKTSRHSPRPIWPGYADTVPEDGKGDYLTDQRELFVGLVDLVPTGSRVVDSAAQQVSVKLTRTEYGTVSSVGQQNIDYDFISYLNARVHKVEDGETDDECVFDCKDKNAYFAEVTFVYDERLSPVEGANPVMLEEVYVTMDEDAMPACRNSSGRWTDFENAVEQDCGPKTFDWAGDKCPQVSLPDDKMGRIYIPLPEGKPDGETIHIEFKLHMEDPTGARAELDVALDLVVMRFMEWCTERDGSVDLAGRVQPSLIIGSSVNSPPRLYAPEDPQEFSLGAMGVQEFQSNAETLQDGLVTLILELPESEDGLEVFVEDIVVVHVNPGVPSPDDIVAQGPNGHSDFIPTFKFDPDTRDARVIIPERLISTCPSGDFTASFFGCTYKQVVFDKGIPNSDDAYLVGSSPPPGTGAQDFMANMLGTATAEQSARVLGRDYEQYLMNEHDISPNNPKKLGLWINPGHKWGGITHSSQYSLSNNLVIYTLFGVRAGVDGPVRRMLLQSTATGEQGRLATVKYNVDAAKVVESLLPGTVTSSFKVTMGVDATTACLPVPALREMMGERLQEKVTPFASAVRDVQVVSLSVENIDCGNSRRLLAGTPRVVMDTVVALEDKEGYFIDFEALVAADPDVLSMAHTGGSPAVDAAEEEAEEEAKKDDSSSDNTAVIAGAAAGAVVLVAIVVLVVMKRKGGSQEPEVVSAGVMGRQASDHSRTKGNIEDIMWGDATKPAP